MHPLHPMVVHFPIALLMVSVLFDVLATKWRPASFRDTSFYTLVLGVLGAGLTVLTGAIAEEGVEESGIPENVLDLHEALGYATFWLFLGILGLRIAMQQGWIRERPLVPIIAGILGVLVLATASYFGGSLVYDFGAGIAIPPTADVVP